MKKVLVMVFIFGMVVTDCKKDKQKVTPSPFLDTEWTLSYIENVSTKATTNFPDDADRKIKLVFHENGVLSFTGICNTGNGNFTIDSYDETSGGLTVSNVVLTKIGCPHVEWEGYVSQSLGSATSYKITGNTLLISSTGDYNLYFINK